jgi:hypothetical protein
MNNRRIELLQELLYLKKPVNQVIAELSEFDWDVDTSLVTLTASIAESVLQQYINGTASESEIENWANGIEVRDDIDFELDCEDTLSQFVFELANPILTQEITIESAKDWINRLAKCKAIGPTKPGSGLEKGKSFV